MSAVRPRDPELRVPAWPEEPGAVPDRIVAVGDPDVVTDDLGGDEVPAPPPVPTSPRPPTWTRLGLAGSALAAPWVWAAVASRLPLPTEQQGVALIAGWLGMAVVAHVVADPRRDP